MLGLPKAVTTWLRDWFGGSSTLAAEKSFELTPALLAEAGGLVAYPFAGDLLDLLPAGLPPERTVILQAVLSLVMLGLANYFVTAKETVAGKPAGWGDKPAQTEYRYLRPEGERLLLKLATGILVLLWVLVYWPVSETPTCRLSVSVASTGGTAARPVYLATRAGERELGRLSVSADNGSVALDIPGVHVSGWSLVVGWNDGKTSSFQSESGCPKEKALASQDGKARLQLRSR
jgi:hypothetical protein